MKPNSKWLLLGLVVLLGGCGASNTNSSRTSDANTSSTASQTTASNTSSTTSASSASSASTQSSNTSTTEASKQSESASANTDQVKQTTGKAMYFTQIKAAYDKQAAYRQSLDSKEKQSSVQTPYSAAIQMGDTLKQDYPKDVATIEEAMKDFSQFVTWGKDQFDAFFTDWSASMNQQYKELSTPAFFNSKGQSVLKQAKVDGKQVVWNVWGKVEAEASNYDYLVLASYQATSSVPELIYSP